MGVPVGAWIFFAIFVVVTILFAVFFVTYYSEKHEREPLPFVICIIALTITMVTLVLIPVDIYTVSATRDSSGQLTQTPEAIQAQSNGVQTVYYILYGVIIFFSFIVVPFAYFYYEEWDEDTTIGKRILGGCKYTSLLIIIMIVLIILGLVLSDNTPTVLNAQNAQPYIENLIGTQTDGTKALKFATACLSLVGYLFVVTYTASGMSAMPINMMKGTRSLAADKDEAQINTRLIKENKQRIQSKYIGRDKTMSSKDKKNLNKYNADERLLNRQIAELERRESSWLSKLMTCLRPFQIVFGILFLLFSLLLITSLTLSMIDRTMNSVCGMSCGFILNQPQIFNPYDRMMLALSSAFPMDFLVLTATNLYFFFCTVDGIIRIGIRFIWLHLYKVRARNTVPQGMLFACVILMLTLLALNVEIVALAPSYASYGTEVFAPGQRCYPGAPTLCTLSQVATFVNTLSVTQPFFGSAFYFLNWLFLASWLGGLIYAIFKARASNIEADSDDESDVE